MKTYVYSIIRYAPRPSRGEYVNVGLIIFDGAEKSVVFDSDTKRVEVLSRGKVKSDSVDKILVGFHYPETVNELLARSNRTHELVWFSYPCPLLAESVTDAIGLVRRNFLD